ncbi:MAG TPA: hypothetical protein VKG65_01055 [Terriglobales bacterium]|nr:hypothetical protein [Terriglobales bacterium]
MADQILCSPLYGLHDTELLRNSQYCFRVARHPGGIPGRRRHRYAAGHFSYRNVAYAMYEAVAQRYPALAKYFRVTDVREPVDLLKR